MRLFVEMQDARRKFVKAMATKTNRGLEPEEAFSRSSLSDASHGT